MIVFDCFCSTRTKKFNAVCTIHRVLVTQQGGIMVSFECQSVTSFNGIGLLLSFCCKSNFENERCWSKKNLQFGFIVQTTLVSLLKSGTRNINKLCEIRLNEVTFTLPSNKNLIIIAFFAPLSSTPPSPSLPFFPPNRLNFGSLAAHWTNISTHKMAA